MAFMDKIVDSFSAASQDVSNRAKAVTGSVKITNQIKANERMMEKLYTQLGAQYFKDHGKETGTVYQDFFDEIHRLTMENEAYSAELEKLNTANVCPQCGHRNNLEAKFCISCGAGLNPVSKPGNACPDCGASNDEGAVFCTECGTKL